MDVVWKAHNEVIHGKPIPSMYVLDNNLSRLFSLTISSLVHVPTRACYFVVCPFEGWVKINFDVAISPSYAMAAVVARDSQGVILDWKTKFFLLLRL